MRKVVEGPEGRQVEHRRGCFTSLLATFRGVYRSNNYTRPLLPMLSKPFSFVSWDLSGAPITNLSALSLWVLTYQADIRVHPIAIK